MNTAPAVAQPILEPKTSEHQIFVAGLKSRALSRLWWILLTRGNISLSDNSRVNSRTEAQVKKRTKVDMKMKMEINEDGKSYRWQAP